MFLKKKEPQAVHEGVACDTCSQFPLTGIRYKCGNCTDFDLCENCEKTTSHDPSHVFIQIRTPLPDVYADLHTPLLSTNIYPSTPAPTPAISSWGRGAPEVLSCSVSPVAPPSRRLNVERESCKRRPPKSKHNVKRDACKPRRPAIEKLHVEREACKRASPLDLPERKVMVISPDGKQQNVTMKETESVQDLIKALTNLSIDVDISKLTRSVTSGSFRPSPSDPSQTLDDAQLANGTVFDLRSRAASRED